MMSFNLYIVFSVVAVFSCSAYANYAPGNYAAPLESPSDYQLQGISSNAEAANAAASANSIDGNSLSNPGPNLYGNPQNIPYSAGNTRGNTLTSSITYPQNKGEILIHRPAAIIVKRPPTKVLVNHPPLVVKPAPVVLHKPPAVVLRKVFVKQHPRPVKVEPVYVNVVKPPAEKYFVNEKQAVAAGYAPVGTLPSPSSAATSAGVSSSAFATGNDAANAGYQLLPNSLNVGGIVNQGAYNPSY